MPDMTWEDYFWIWVNQVRCAGCKFFLLSLLGIQSVDITSESRLQPDSQQL